MMSEEKSPIRDAAESLYSQISEISEDILEDLWFSQHENYEEFTSRCTSEELDAWQEPIFCQVMAELSLMCAKRANGETP